MPGHGAAGCSCETCAARREATAAAYRVKAILEDRAAGRKRWSGAGAALTWYARTRSAWCSPKAIPLQVESGAPSRGAESPTRRLFAAVAGALKAAELDDRDRHPAKEAPVQRWALEHFGAGRAYTWMAEESGGRWTEVEIANRMRRVCRKVREHLEAGGWLE